MYWHPGCANTGTISIQRAGAKVRIHISKIIPQKYFSVFALMRIQAPHVFAQKLIPQEFFPACIGFVPGGMPEVVQHKVRGNGERAAQGGIPLAAIRPGGGKV